MSLAKLPIEVSFYKPKRSNCIKHPYERGMFISINNYKTHTETIYQSIKKQYQTIEYGLTKKNYSRDDLKISYGKSPNPKKLMDEVVVKKKILMVAGIHNYDRYNYKTQSGSKIHSGYQHLHLYLYGINNLLPTNTKSLENKIKHLKILLMRHNQVYKKKEESSIDIRTVGTGENLFNDVVCPTSLYEYINYPKTNPNKICCINYIADTMQYNKQNYPLVYVYRS